VIRDLALFAAVLAGWLVFWGAALATLVYLAP
jgi:hypothetical protein